MKRRTVSEAAVKKAGALDQSLRRHAGGTRSTEGPRSLGEAAQHYLDKLAAQPSSAGYGKLVTRVSGLITQLASATVRRPHSGITPDRRTLEPA